MLIKVKVGQREYSLEFGDLGSMVANWTPEQGPIEVQARQ